MKDFRPVVNVGGPRSGRNLSIVVTRLEPMPSDA